MGVGKMGKLAILLPRRLSPSVSEREKAYLGEKVTLEKKGWGWALLAFCWARVSVRTVRKDGR